MTPGNDSVVLSCFNCICYPFVFLCCLYFNKSGKVKAGEHITLI